MGLETGTKVQDLVATNPVGSDKKSAGDDHIRLIKLVLKNTFPNSSKAFYFPSAATKAADYAILAGDMNSLITFDATAAARTATLPTLTSDDKGWSVLIAKIDASVHAVTVAGTVNGNVLGYPLTRRFQLSAFRWDGSNWYAGSELVVDASGNVYIDDLTTVNVLLTGLLDLSQVTDHMFLPIGTTAQRDGSPETGMFRLNGDTFNLEYYGNGAWVVVEQKQAPKGYHFGCTVSNNVAAPTTSLDITAGVWRSHADTSTLLGTAMTKSLASAWVAGTNQGFRSSASLADGTWHVFLIGKSDGTTDYLAHTALDPTSVLPAGYTEYRRIFSFIRASSIIRLFVQTDNRVAWVAPVVDFSGAFNGTKETTFTIPGLPNGIVVEGDFFVRLASSGWGSTWLCLYDAGITTAPTIDNTTGPGQLFDNGSHVEVKVMSSNAQVIKGAANSNTSGTVSITTLAYRDLFLD